MFSRAEHARRALSAALFAGLAIPTTSLIYTVETVDGRPALIATQTTDSDPPYIYKFRYIYVDLGYGASPDRRLWWSDLGAQGEVQNVGLVSSVTGLGMSGLFTAWSSACAEFLGSLVAASTPSILLREIRLNETDGVESYIVVWKITQPDESAMIATWTYQALPGNYSFVYFFDPTAVPFAVPLQSGATIHGGGSAQNDRIAQALEDLLHKSQQISLNNGAVIYQVDSGDIIIP